MISTISAVQNTDLLDTVRKITQTEQAITSGGVNKAASDVKAPSFGDMLSSLVKSVDTKSKEAGAAATAIMTGKSDNIHQAMLSMQEAGTAFTMMSEVRNKLVSAYQELMRMQV